MTAPRGGTPLQPSQNKSSLGVESDRWNLVVEPPTKSESWLAQNFNSLGLRNTNKSARIVPGIPARVIF